MISTTTKTATEIVYSTIVGSTFTSKVATETVIEQAVAGGSLLLLAGAITTTIPIAITVDGPPAIIIAQTLTNTVFTTIPLSIRDVTHYLLRETVMRTVFATTTDKQLITVAVTTHNQITETIILGTSTTIENVVIAVIGTRPTSTVTATAAPVVVTTALP